MKKISLKSGLISGLCLAAAGYAMTASAHDMTGALTATGGIGGPGAGATDTYAITCFQDATMPSQAPTDHLYIAVRDDSAAGGQVSATALLATGRAVSVTDTTPADGIASTSKILKVVPAAQNVTYTIVVHHTAGAADNYLVSAHCQDSANNHTGTQEPIVLQTQ